MKIEKVKPMGNHVLVKRSKAKLSKGGILLPDSAQEKPKQGEVIAIGPGKLDDAGKLIKMETAVGDFVLFSAYSGVEVKSEDDTEYLIMSEEDILGILV